MEALGFRPYENYEDSRVDWIGGIPNTWAVERAKWLFKRMDRSVRPDDEIVTCFRDGQVTLRNNRRTEGFTTALKEHGYQGIRKGDLVIHAMDAFAGAIGVSDSDGKATPVYSACVPRQPNTVDPSFYAYYMRHLALSGFLVSLSKGIRERSTDFRFNDFAELEIVFPSLVEQSAIAAFLDVKCAKIEAAVNIKEDQIALLRERRQIVIQDAVTRGLDPAAPMKESGIDWIGQIPAHWEVKRNKHMFAEINERSAKGKEQHLSMSQKLGLVPANLVEKSLVSESYEGAKLVQPGDLVLNRLKAHLAVFSIAPLEGLVSPDYSVFRPFVVGASSRYYEALFKTSKYLGEFRLRVRGIVEGFYRLYTASFMDIPLLIPPQAEQGEIVDHLHRLSAKFENAISMKNAQIAALKEYRTSLINAAVTGKIKVI